MGKREVVKTKWQPNIPHRRYIEPVFDSFPLSIIVKLSGIIDWVMNQHCERHIRHFHGTN